MALYIAIYDVHPGDRKHFERLLQRISDKRSTPSDILYIESYGSVDALLKTTQKFDAIIIDASEEYDEGAANISIATTIRDCGLSIPLALYLPEGAEISTQNLLLSKSLKNITFYNKSIKLTDLETIVAIARTFSDNRIARIELRDAKTTHFVLPDDIVFAAMEDSFMNVYLSNGENVRILKTLNEFIRDLSGYMHYIQVGRDKIINLNHVSEKKSLSFILDNNKTISYSLFEKQKMNALFEKYQKIKGDR